LLQSGRQKDFAGVNIALSALVIGQSLPILSLVTSARFEIVKSQQYKSN
jgi:hypothetical protein